MPLSSHESLSQALHIGQDVLDFGVRQLSLPARHRRRRAAILDRGEQFRIGFFPARRAGEIGCGGTDGLADRAVASTLGTVTEHTALLVNSLSFSRISCCRMRRCGRYPCLEQEENRHQNSRPQQIMSHDRPFSNVGSFGNELVLLPPLQPKRHVVELGRSAPVASPRILITDFCPVHSEAPLCQIPAQSKPVTFPMPGMRE